MAEWLTGVYTVLDHCGSSSGLVVENAFDDDTGTAWIHNVTDAPHFVDVDMGAAFVIEKIRRYKISGGAYNWVNARLYVSDDPDVWGSAVLTFTTGTANNSWSEHTLSPSATGRYFRIECEDTTSIINALATTEIQVFATLGEGEDPPPEPDPDPPTPGEDAPALPPVLTGVTLPDPYEYIEEPELRGASVEMPDGSVYFDPAQAVRKRTFILRFRGLTAAQRVLVDSSYAAIKNSYTASNYTAPTGTVYTVTRHPEQKSLRWRLQPVAASTLYWETELRLREV